MATTCMQRLRMRWEGRAGWPWAASWKAAMSWTTRRGKNIRNHEGRCKSLPVAGARGQEAVKKGVKELLGEGGPAREPGEAQRRLCQLCCATSVIQTLAAVAFALSVRPAESINSAHSRGSKQGQRRLQERVGRLGECRSAGRRCSLACRPVRVLTLQG